MKFTAHSHCVHLFRRGQAVMEATVRKTPPTARRDGRRTWGLWFAALIRGGAAAGRQQAAVTDVPFPPMGWRINAGGEGETASGSDTVTATSEFAAARAAQTPFAVVLQRGRN